MGCLHEYLHTNLVRFWNEQERLLSISNLTTHPAHMLDDILSASCLHSAYILASNLPIDTPNRL